jgi:hypothetical protein
MMRLMLAGQTFSTALARHPRRLFLVDGAGASLTAVCVGLVLPSLPGAVGMPVVVLRSMALAASLLALTSLGCAWAGPRPWARWLRALAAMNTSYCLVTLVCLMHFRTRLRALDWIYFVAEILVVSALVALELRVAARTSNAPAPPR